MSSLSLSGDREYRSASSLLARPLARYFGESLPHQDLELVRRRREQGVAHPKYRDRGANIPATNRNDGQRSVAQIRGHDVAADRLDAIPFFQCGEDRLVGWKLETR